MSSYVHSRDRERRGNYSGTCPNTRNRTRTVQDFTHVVIDPTQVLPNGNLVFPPFRAEDYRQEVHAQVYSCLARSSSGSVHSRDVNVRAGKRRLLFVVCPSSFHPV